MPRWAWRLPLAGLLPMGREYRTLRAARLFDATHYLAANRDLDRAALDPLIHYLCFGGFEGRAPNRFFDSGWYLAQHPAAAASGLNPLVHYVRAGWKAGLAAGPEFDTQFYLASNPDVAKSGMNPLFHYLRHGWREGRRANRKVALAARPKAPPEEAWRGLRPRSSAGETAIDVIVPVYKGHDETLAALHAVLSANVSAEFELTVIDDRSPDERLSQTLRRLSGEGLFTLICNPANLGFVASVNRGMALHPARDVVLLNADTEVYDGWLDRLAAHATGNVGTVTPFSNNATICSYPVANRDNEEALEISYRELAGLFAGANAGQAVALPTAVGFCMLIRRACLAAAGPFDAAAFGKGYGEENDFCCRASGLGWRHLLAGDVFVRHLGAVSFGAGAPARLREALAVLGRRHPQYFAAVREHIAADPALALRCNADRARLALAAGRSGIAHVTHTWGGGIARHVADLAREAGGALTLSPARGEAGRVAVNAVPPLDLPNLGTFDLAADGAALGGLLRQAGIARLHIHSLAGWPEEAPLALRGFAEAEGFAYDFTFHDYLAFCPRINLVDATGFYCGELGEAQCRACLPRRTAIGPWRQRHGALLAGAGRLMAPSRDTAERAQRYLGGRPVAILPHAEPAARPGPGPLSFARGEELRVLTVGAIGPHKGAAVLLAMAEDALRRDLPLRFVIIGHSDRDQAFLRCANVEMTGHYGEDELAQLMAAHRGHVALIPAVWPETYSYVLSACLAEGYRVAAFDVGAIAERLRDGPHGRALLLPLELAARPAAVNDRLLAAMGSGG